MFTFASYPKKFGWPTMLSLSETYVQPCVSLEMSTTLKRSVSCHLIQQSSRQAYLVWSKRCCGEVGMLRFSWGDGCLAKVFSLISAYLLVCLFPHFLTVLVPSGYLWKKKQCCLRCQLRCYWLGYRLGCRGFGTICELTLEISVL